MTPHKRISFRAYPKIVFAWPIALAAAAAAAAMLYWPNRMNQIGLLFMLIALLNLFVLAFEFSRGKSMSVALGAVGLTSTLMLFNQKYPIFRPLQRWLQGREVHASVEFYFFLAAGLAVVFAGIFLRTRFDYWTLSSSELVHRKGFLGESERFSTSGIKLRKEITDVFEYLMLGAARIILTIPGQANPIVLENVLGSHWVERFAEEVLDARLVRLEEGSFPNQRSA